MPSPIYLVCFRAYDIGLVVVADRGRFAGSFLFFVFVFVSVRRGSRAAHVGGLVAGILVGWALFHKSAEESRMLREPLLKKAIRLQGKSERPRFKTLECPDLRRRSKPYGFWNSDQFFWGENYLGLV